MNPNDTTESMRRAAEAAPTTRRRLLTLLGALPAALGLGFLAESDAAAKKQGKKGKKRGKKGKGGGYSPDGEERAFLDLINDYRRKNGVGQLSLNDKLGAAAKHHSRDMAKKNYFSHKLANGDSAEQNIRRFGYTNYRFVGENIFAGDKSASKAMAAWKKSRDHNRNMLSKDFDEIGIGRAHGKKSKYGWYWTTTFGKRG
ncbi:MAG: CAP domain-containing protein [Thermomicrobiales bacterium]|nr:CAP domain-containing protein [Thermomicrobiales bacterium]